jgi:multicomponent Na+:H+ antiporter subunit D
MNLFLILPILVPFSTAIAALFAWKARRVQRLVSLLGAIGLFGCALGLIVNVYRNGIQAAQIGGWPAPFGITLAVDLFGAIMVVLAGLIGLAVAAFSLVGIDPRRESFGYYPLLHVLLMGVCGAFMTGDIFNLYVWFEVMLIASFVLMELGGEKAQLEGAIKYVTLNLVSSALFLTAVAVLYGVVGTLNMADLARQLPMAEGGLETTVAILFFLAFGIKAAIFPLFFWLPASYHTPPPPVSAIFAGLLTKVGVYAMIRTFTLLFVHNPAVTHRLILLAAGMTMLTGVLGAISQKEFRRILSFHIVGHIGYMIMGLGLFTPLALAGAIFYTFHHIIVQTNLFLVSGIVHGLQGTNELKKMGGLYAVYPGLALVFLIPALALAGVPPLSGFWAKFLLVKAGLEAREYLIVAVALLVGLLTLYSVTEIWAEAFWKPQPGGGAPANEPDAAPGRGAWIWLAGPVVGLALLTVVIGLVAEPFVALATRAAEQLLNPDAYVGAVLGGRP